MNEEKKTDYCDMFLDYAPEVLKGLAWIFYGLGRSTPDEYIKEELFTALQYTMEHIAEDFEKANQCYMHTKKPDVIEGKTA